jgi:deoxyribodipyrimidine photo-lyase
MPTINLFWFRRDLRLHDNAGLYHALRSEHPVLPLFIFDRNILDELEDKQDARVEFIHNEISNLYQQLKDLGSSIVVKYGTPVDVFRELLSEYDINAVYTNHDYEPYAKRRDERVGQLLEDHDVAFNTYKDQVIFESREVTKDDGDPYVVFTPYSRKWREKLTEETESTNGETISSYFKTYPTEDHFDNFYSTRALALIELDEMGFAPTDIEIPQREVKRSLIKNYDETRDYPAENGTSRLGIHFRFGTISIREKARRAQRLNDTFLNELIWRDFYMMILDNFPHVIHQSFRPEYDYIQWRNDEDDFQAWCAGKTGYPIVDAGMRQLNEIGYMHNRVRMITASFLTKHLLIDWRWGEAYFARKLLDYELSSNNGGWQWAAGSGTDAAPYFRIFNPWTQQKKFDPDLKYIKQWIPEYGSDTYPEPIVEHKFARERCLETYKVGLDKGKSELK